MKNFTNKLFQVNHLGKKLGKFLINGKILELKGVNNEADSSKNANLHGANHADKPLPATENNSSNLV